MQKTYSYIVWFLFEFHIPTRLSVYMIWGDHIGPKLGNTLKNVHVNKGARKKDEIISKVLHAIFYTPANLWR